MNEKSDGAAGGQNAQRPGDERNRGIGRSGPEHGGQQDQANKTNPFEYTASPRWCMRIAAARRTRPMLPESDGQNWNKENVADIERAGCNRPPRPLARPAVVIAKAHSLRPPVVYAVDEEHGDLRGRFDSDARRRAGDLPKATTLGTGFKPEIGCAGWGGVFETEGVGPAETSDDAELPGGIA